MVGESELKELLLELNEWEIKILCIILARIGGSQHRTFHRANVKRKATDEEEPHVDDALNSLKNKNFIRVKRAPDNFDVTSKGFKLAKHFREKRRADIYKDIRIIKRP